MTEERLTEILIDHRVCERMANGRTFVAPSALEAMKQAVNEAVQECVDSLTAIGSVNQNQDLFFKHHKDANNKRILKLKVK